MLLKRSQQLSRRRLLRGACGAALALPTLEWSLARADISRHPRFLVYYLPNGRRHEWWNPNAEGQLPDESRALRRFAERTTHLIDLDNNAARRSPGAGWRLRARSRARTPRPPPAFRRKQNRLRGIRSSGRRPGPTRCDRRTSAR